VAALLLGAVALVALVGQQSSTGAEAVALNVGAAAVSGSLGLAILIQRLPRPIRLAKPHYHTWRWLRSALPFAWVLGMNVVLTYADTILVGLLSGPASAAVYRVASQAAMLVTLPLTAVNAAVAPLLAASYSRGDKSELQSKARAAAGTASLAALPAALVLLSLGRPLLAFFGPGFSKGYTALAILVLGYLVNAAAGASGYLLIMTNYERAAAASFTCAAVINVVANFVLIPLWGTTGAAVATALSVTFVSLAFSLLVRRNLGIESMVMWRPK